jgi:hypothetical protein
VDLPSHPDTDDPRGAPPPRPPSGWTVRIVIAAVAALLTLMVVLHLTGALGPAG